MGEGARGWSDRELAIRPNQLQLNLHSNDHDRFAPNNVCRKYIRSLLISINADIMPDKYILHIHEYLWPWRADHGLIVLQSDAQ